MELPDHGQWVCGPQWQPPRPYLTELLLSEGEDWSDCLSRNDGEVDLVVCPDDRPVVAL